MFHSIINEYDILYNSSDCSCSACLNSSNPYDYLGNGYHIDNADLYGGKNDVSYSFNIPSNI